MRQKITSLMQKMKQNRNKYGKIITVISMMQKIHKNQVSDAKIMSKMLKMKFNEAERNFPKAFLTFLKVIPFLK